MVNRSGALKGTPRNPRKPKFDRNLAQPPSSTVRAGRKICLITTEIAQFDPFRVTSTSFSPLLDHYLALDADISLLVVSDLPTTHPEVREFCRFWNRRNVHVRFHSVAGKGSENLFASFVAMKILLEERFDLVIFGSSRGVGYYSLLAKNRSNPNLQTTRFCVLADGPPHWSASLAESPLRSLEELQVAEMERRSVELADCVLVPSQYILDLYRREGIKIPDTAIVLRSAPIALTGRVDRSHERLTGITYFGKLDTRSGLWLLCSAIDRVRAELVGRKVTFVGSPVLEGGQSTDLSLIRRSASWPCEIEIRPELSQDALAAFLRRENHLVVLPSGAGENSPLAMTCVSESIPFLSSSESGIAELILQDDRQKCLFEPTAKSLGTLLERSLDQAVSSPRLCFHPETILAENALALNTLLDAKEQNAVASTAVAVALVYIVPLECTEGVLASAIARSISDYPEGTEVTLLCADPSGVGSQMKLASLAKVNIVPLDDAGSALDQLAVSSAAAIGISHPSQPLPYEWMLRAAGVFSHDESVSIVVGVATDPAKGPGPKDLDEHADVPALLLVEPSVPLATLSLATNSGFAAFRPGVQPISSGLLSSSPNRLKPMRHWLHEVCCLAVLEGRGVALIPDVSIPDALDERPTEVFEVGTFIRALLARDFPKGSDAALVVKLVESELRKERLAAHLACLMKHPTGDSVLSMSSLGSGSLDELIQIAVQVGHLETAAELLASKVSNGLTLLNLGELFLAAASEIRLIDRAVQNEGMRLINLDRDWSYKLAPVFRRIELHPNRAHEGRAALEFSSIDLRSRNSFTCKIGLPEASRAIRFRVDIISEIGHGRMTADQILEPGRHLEWQIALPADVRNLVRCVLSVEAADPALDPIESLTYWTEPTFRQETGALGQKP